MKQVWAWLYSPVTYAEFRHQRFVIAKSRVGWGWILLAMALLLPAFTFSVWYVGLVLLTPERPELLQHAQLDGTLVLLIVMAVSMYVVMVLMAVALSANSIRREKRNNTWDNLRLTGISASRIVWGKWVASLRALLGDHLMATLLRIGLTGAFIFLAMADGWRDPAHLRNVFLVSVGVHVVFTVLDASLSVALGLFSAVFEGSAGTLANLLIIGARLWLSLYMVGGFFFSMGVLVTGETVGLFLIMAGGGLYLLLIGGILWGASWFVK